MTRRDPTSNERWLAIGLFFVFVCLPAAALYYATGGYK